MKAEVSGERLWEFSWKWVPGEEAAQDEELVGKCARLFSREYGSWGAGGPHPGKPIRISEGRVRELLQDEDAWIASAYHHDELIGYCIALRSDMPGKGSFSWITQLVVAGAYRKSRIATKLLYSIWGFSDDYAWGLVTANPYAVRALETATRRPCRLRLIRQEGAELLKHLAERVPYIPDRLADDASGNPLPILDTEFYIELGGLPKMLRKAARAERRWALGRIKPGQEWFACTFHSQIPDLTETSRLSELLVGADDVWIHAYEGMTLDERHHWHVHTEDEISFVVDITGMGAGARALDVGCGDGRHSLALAAAGLSVTGVDISPRLVESARNAAVNTDVELAVADARQELPPGPFDLVLCLYDVLGSSAQANHDRRIVENIRSSLMPGGLVVASVMNANVTINNIAPDRRPTNRQELVEALEALPPSRTMEESGNVFDSDLLLEFEGIHYRKEQFISPGNRLPGQLLIRDKRYTVPELRELFESVGLKVLRVVPVQAGKWERTPPLSDDDERAKELLILAKKVAGNVGA